LMRYEEILKYQPSNAAVHQKAADSAMVLENYRQALTHYTASLNKNPNNEAALKGAGKAHMMLGQYSQALPYFKKALDTNRSSANYANLGVSYDLSNNSAEAQRIYREALLQMPDDLNVRNNMGLSMLLSGNHDGAIDVLQSVVASPKATGTHYANLALAYGIAGKESAAKRVLEKVVSKEDAERNVEIYRELTALKGTSLKEAVLMGDVRGTKKKQIDE
jgi:Flp pilus assembly protein TadD